MAALFVTDLDGTLLDSRSQLTSGVRLALAQVRRAGVVCVVATGRSLYSAREVLRDDDPIDYLIYSSGAGLVRWADGRSLHTWSMCERAAREATAWFEARAVDFMVHAPAPDSHRFAFRSYARHPDLLARVDRYRAHCWPLSAACPWRGPACQVLAMPVMSADPDGFCREVAQALPDHAIVRTTSPLDHRSLWVEVFANHVSKASASACLASELGIPAQRCFAVGNDYNDESLLAWAAGACVMGNGPEPLRRRYVGVPGHDEDGVVAALRHFGLRPDDRTD